MSHISTLGKRKATRYKSNKRNNVHLQSFLSINTSKNSEGKSVETLLTKDVLKDLLQEEETLRLSPEWQNKFKTSEYNYDNQVITNNDELGQSDWIDHVDQLQRIIISRKLQQLLQREVSENEVERGIYSLQTATIRYPELKSIPLYVRFNRARRGSLKVGDMAPDVPLYSFDFLNYKLNNKDLVNLTSLSSIWRQKPDQPLLVIASSFS